MKVRLNSLAELRPGYYPVGSFFPRRLHFQVHCTATMTTDFASRILDWFDHHGRHDLPWQQDTSPYRVWVSEIMLQQTQVKTVIPYYQRFLNAFPTVHELAAATEDEVLHLWTGLGYYARARNLHKAAKYVSEQLSGVFPDSLEALQELPGVGRSTAGAILSIAHGQRASILDGNVKRVLARFHAVEGWPGQRAVHDRLWDIAEQYTPAHRCADYTQAMMDLGATLCTRAAPRCEDCPLQADCAARSSGTQRDFPGRKPRKTLPVKETRLLMIRDARGDLLLEKRPASGIWGGLWCFPEAASLAPETACLDLTGHAPAKVEPWPGFRHTFSHYHLDIEPLLVEFAGETGLVMDADRQLWYNLRQPPQIGLAAPVVGLLAQLARHGQAKE